MRFLCGKEDTNLLDAKFDAPLGVRVPLAHNGENLRNGRLWL
jgi:hypothetical protein